jgi:hypothetical protein
MIEDRDDLMKVFGEKHPNYIQYADSNERRKKQKQIHGILEHLELLMEYM